MFLPKKHIIYTFQDPDMKHLENNLQNEANVMIVSAYIKKTLKFFKVI